MKLSLGTLRFVGFWSQLEKRTKIREFGSPFHVNLLMLPTTKEWLLLKRRSFQSNVKKIGPMQITEFTSSIFCNASVLRSLLATSYAKSVCALRFQRYKHHTPHSTEGSHRKIRNVGLIAHIDAGKTTTTERMLYFAGRTRVVGEVDRGDTVTDYLDEERERGISIMSAAACLTWKHHDVHLIDTPGHVDFTFEVERGLAAVDSALIIIDACKGVESQTRTVWSQADRYQLPRMIFINKMDRPMADFGNSLDSLRQRFSGTFFPIQMPVFTGKDRFIGIVDLPSFTLKIWPNPDGVQSSQVDLFKVLASDGPSKSDDAFANEYLLVDNPERLLPVDVVSDCVRKVTISSRGFPVLVGSSRRNIGVEPVLDGIVDYLPDPSQRLPPPLITNSLRRIQNASRGNQAPPVLLTFKILFDPQRGPLSLTRVFSGSVKPGMQIKNWTRRDLDEVSCIEKVGGLMQLTGDAYENLDSAGPGYIVALSGLQSTRTGDILGPVIECRAEPEEAEAMDDGMEGAFVPQPVIHAALEPRSSSAFRNLERALACMQREDPSFKASFNSETGQWVIAGMGDLHLEIVLSRLRRQYKLDVSMGPLLISHKEMPEGGNESVGATTSTGIVGGRQRTIFVELVARSSGHLHASETPQVTFNKAWIHQGSVGVGHSGYGDPQSAGTLSKIMACVRQGCEVALMTGGPLLHSRVVGVSLHVRRIGQLPTSSTVTPDADLTRIQVPTSSQSFVSFTALLRSAVMKAANEALVGLPDWKVMEPVMAVELRLPIDVGSGKDTSVTPFISELSRRRGEIEGVEVVQLANGTRECCLQAFAPLAELQDFSATVRSLSSGMADLSLRLADFRPVSADRQVELLRRLGKFS
uniref:Tr-type G domain-containing protein n=1 Tax=Mesocestoides corti TaxID=53468 RepID=A0A5K3FGA2_MESCO